jgi:arylformamidase
VKPIHDISVPIRSEMVTYPGNPPVLLERVDSIHNGHSCNVSRLDLGVHTGTHVDAPLHFVEGGAAVETLSLEILMGAAQVVAADGPGDIEPAAVAAVAAGTERVLFKTRNSEAWADAAFRADFARLSPGAAELLVARGVRLVGVDYLSVGGAPTHRLLLEAGLVALEGLDLRGVEPGFYELVCLPLRLVGADGAPARAVLLGG